MHHKKGRDRGQMFFTSLEEMVPVDSFARVIDLVVDALPFERLEFRHAELKNEGTEPDHPRDILKLMIYGQRHGMRSANKMSYGCVVNTEMKWLMNGLQPSARTICYFRSENTSAIKKAHRHFVKLLQSWDMLSGEALGAELTYKKQNSKRKYRVKRYGTGKCEGCVLRSKCTTSASGRKVERANHQEHVERNDSRVRRYYDFYRLRQQIVEPVFGLWKRQWHFDHVLLRGREKVEGEVSMAALTWNIMRLVQIKGKEWIEKALRRALFMRYQPKRRQNIGGQIYRTIIFPANRTHNSVLQAA